MTTFVQEVMNPGGLTRYSILLLIFSQPTLLKVRTTHTHTHTRVRSWQRHTA